MAIPVKRYRKITNSDSLKKLESRVVTYFNLYIRLRDMKFNGMGEINGNCISCCKRFEPVLYSDKSIMNGREIVAGHYFLSDRHASVRFDERNVNLQCYRCNKYLSGNLAKYLPSLIDKIGQDQYNLLVIAKNQTHKFDYFELERMRDLYKQKAKIEATRLGIKI
jgi:hypothetical protein